METYTTSFPANTQPHFQPVHNLSSIFFIDSFLIHGSNIYLGKLFS